MQNERRGKAFCIFHSPFLIFHCVRATSFSTNGFTVIASSFNLLAFGFASPALLGWLALAAVPVLIHWLFRRRYREVTWAAMQFLHAAARKQSRRTRLEQLLLLAARVLILALIVFALARPRWVDAGKLAGIAPPTLRVIVLDASLSLGRKAAVDDNSAATLFEAGKVIARDIVKKSSSGDRFALARIAGSEPRLLIRQPTLVTSAVLEEIDRLPLTFERGDVAATLRQLSELFAAKQPRERCEVVVISDFQTEAWDVEHVFNVLKSDGHVGNVLHELVLIDVGPSQPDNAAVVGLTTDPPILAAEQPMSVTATLRNAGNVPLTARRVELRIDEQLTDSRRVDFPLGQDATVEFTLTAPASGEHTLSVRLEEDSLAADNERWLPLSVRSELSVLLVNGRPSARPRDAATFFVEQALSPKTADRAASSRWLQVTTVPDSELPNIELDRHDVVFLCDVGTLSEQDVERLRRFAESGGGVIVSLGPSVSVEKLNEFAFGERGLMTLHFDEMVTSMNDDGTASAFGFDPGDFTHSLLREFRGNPAAGLETALVRQYVRTEIIPTQRPIRFGSVEIALRFSNGEAAILTQSLSRGRCVLITTSLDETWGEWAIWAPGFVPLMHELTQYAAMGGSQPRELLVGEPILGELAPDPAKDNTHPGVFQSTTSKQFAINVDPRESDPRRIDPQELSESFGGSSVRVHVRVADALTPDVSESPELETHSLTLGLLTVVLALLLVEQALAWRFSAGSAVILLLLVLASVWLAARAFLAGIAVD